MICTKTGEECRIEEFCRTRFEAIYERHQPKQSDIDPDMIGEISVSDLAPEVAREILVTDCGDEIEERLGHLATGSRIDIQADAQRALEQIAILSQERSLY